MYQARRSQPLNVQCSSACRFEIQDVKRRPVRPIEGCKAYLTGLRISRFFCRPSPRSRVICGLVRVATDSVPDKHTLQMVIIPQPRSNGWLLMFPV